jgi:hypothetical protein
VQNKVLVFVNNDIVLVLCCWHCNIFRLARNNTVECCAVDERKGITYARLLPALPTLMHHANKLPKEAKTH